MYTVNEVAALLRVSPSTIYRMVKNGELAAVRLPGQLRFTVSAVMDYIDGNSTETPVIYFSEAPETPVG